MVQISRLLKSSFLLLGMLFACVLVLRAQQDFVRYTTQDGLPSNEVYCAYQDAKGFMWFGTDRGLVRFDGYDFEVFSHKDGLKDDVIFHIWQDHRERLWMVTLQRKIFYLEAGVFHEFKHALLKAHFSSPEYVTQTVKLDLEGRKWALATTKFVLEFDHEWDSLKVHENETRGINIKKYSRHEIVSGEMRYENEPGTFYKKIDYLGKGEVQGVTLGGKKHEGRYGGKGLKFESEFWLTYWKQLYVLNGEAELKKKLVFEGNVICLKSTSAGVWVGTLNNGVYLMDTQDKSALNRLLYGYSISAVCEDNTGGHWFTSTNGGVFYWKDIGISSFSFANQGKSFKSEPTVIELKDDSNLFVGFKSGYLCQFEASPYDIGMKMDYKHDIAQAYGCMFYDSMNERLFVKEYYHRRHKAKMIDMSNEVSVHPKLFGPIFSHPQGRVFLKLSGECKWSNSLEEFEQGNGTDIKGLFYSYEHPKSAHQNSKGEKRVALFKGMFVFDEEKGWWKDTLIQELRDVRVERLSELNDSTMLYGTRGKGLVVERNGLVQLLDESFGVLSSSISDMWVNGNDEIFLATNKGINLIRRRSDESWDVSCLTEAHGLPFRDIRLIRSDERYIWGVAKEGVVVVDRERVQYNETPPPLYFTSVLIGDSLLQRFEAAEVPYNQNFVEVNYVALSYKQEGQINYQYRFKNQDSTWIATTQTRLQFPSLQPDFYELEIRASNENGVWSKPIAFHLNILEPIWKRWWFQGAAYLLIVLVVTLAVRYRLRKVKERSKLLQAQNELTHALNNTKQQVLSQQMNPHFFFNSLNSIQNFINKKDVENSNYFLGKFAKLMRRVLDNSQRDFIYLEDELNLIRLYLDLEQMRMDNRFVYTIEIDEELDEDMMVIPNLLLQPYLENAIWHGFSSAQRKDYHLRLIFKSEGDYMLCHVRDNGEGFKMKEASTHRSLGTKITQERVALLNELYACEIEVCYLDEPQEQGVCVQVRYNITQVPVV